MRSLAPDEAELWARVAATIRPLSREPVEPPLAEAAQPQPPAPRPAARLTAPPPEKPRPHAKATLDSTWDRKLQSGSLSPDRVLDLHGRNLDQAWRAIDDSLESAIANEERVLLLITGHARPGKPPVERGKIRAVVHDWLAASRHSRRIAAVRGAHRRHGGAGSLYIILRKARPGSTFS
ncbi:MAG: Smr/MutS family protein [Pseudomonadota bacterium]|nr:Smr/MutS family protein [Sphingomonas sp.]MDQ3479086.1 Smr/MutS family protein [Pseudomonadota bacterium]